MPTFVYTARDRAGKALDGALDAATPEVALATLQNKGYLITSMTLRLSGLRGAARRRRLHGRVTLTDHVLFCQQVGTMLEAGVPLLRALEVVQYQLESRRLLLTLSECTRDVEGGSSFRDALAKHPKVFSPFWINLVETGEASGRLGASLHQLAKYLERVKLLREKLVSALLYPLLLTIMAVAVVGFFSIVVIPMFHNLFAQFNAELPPLTQFVLQAGIWMRQYFLWLLIGGIFLGWLLKRYCATQQGRWVLDRYSLRLPVFGALFYDVQIARFASGLGTLLDSGVPILFALEILERSADNRLFGEAFSTVKNDVRDGKPMTTPMETSGLFPPMVVQMIQVGEEIGQLSTMLGRIAAYYENKINVLTERLAVLFEPIALICVGGMVGFLVVALFLPLFNIATAIH